MFDKKAYMRAYNQSPKVKAYRKAYLQRPKVKAYHKAYNQSPKVKAYRRAYYQRPKVKAYRKAYYQRPKAKAYQKAYQQRPEVKHQKGYSRLSAHYLRQKAKLEQQLKQFIIPPIPLQGKLQSIIDILDNLKLIRAEVKRRGLKGELATAAETQMLASFMEREGMIVSRRKAIKQ